MKWQKPLLIIDRKLAGKWYKQLFMALVPFVVVVISVFVCYLFIRNGSIFERFGQAFVDTTTPESISKLVYDFYNGYVQNETIEQKDIPVGDIIWFTLIYVLGAIAFTGLIISAITSIWRSRSEKFRRGSVSYKFKGHIVFIGYNNLVSGMIQKICEEEDTRIVVGVEKDASVVCDKIKNRLFEKFRKNVVVLKADSCNKEDLERLRVIKAKEIYIIGEYDDSYNLKCYRTIYELSISDPSTDIKMPQCYVNLQSLSTLTLFRTYASAGELGVDFKYFHVFNFDDEWARTILQNDKKRNSGNFQRHIVIAGMTKMGAFLARKAALSCHYPNDDKHTIITFIDNNINEWTKLFISQHRIFFDYCQYSIRTKENVITHRPIKNDVTLDIEFEFIEGELSDNIVRQDIDNYLADNKRLMTVAICYDNSQKNLAMGVNLPENVYDSNNVKVWVYQPTSFDLGKYLKSSRFKNVTTFGMSGDKLDVRNKKNVYLAHKINHFFKHKDDTNIDYSNSKQRLIEAEWESIKIFDQWSCIRRAEFISDLLKYKDDISAMINMEYKRIIVDKLIYGVPLSKEDTDMQQNIHEKYVKSILNDIITN